MRISPEPLQPLRNWRELWHIEAAPATPGFNATANFSQSTTWKQQPKQPAFHWLSHLINRSISD
jgi:hypothetical protein